MALTTETKNHEAERAVLGAMLKDPEGFHELFSLTPRDFDDGRNRQVFRALSGMRAEGKVIDLLTVSQAHPELDAVYLADLLSCALITSAQNAAYREILKSATARRDFLALAVRIEKDCTGALFDGAKLTENIRLYLKGMVAADDEETGITDDLAEMYNAIFERPEDSKGIMMGIEGLDGLTGGLKPTRVYVVGARPSVGKTVFGINAALKAALSGKPVLYINREMQKVDLLKRMAANLSGVNLNAMEGGCVPENEWESVMNTVAAMNAMPVHISNQAKTPAEIRMKAVELQEKEGLGLIVIDYLQRLSSGEKFKSRDEEVGFLSRAIKDIAMDLKVPVLLLSQLNRSASNARPNMAMLRESGNIEQDADVIILLHVPDADDVPGARRDDYRAVRQDGNRYLEMIVDKNRYGGNRIVPVAFCGAQMRYIPLKAREDA